MRVIAIANQKGGCGKTTTSVNLSACLTEKKQKVLLIDIDPQGHSTLAYNISQRDFQASIYDLFCPDEGKSISIKDTIIKISDYLDLIPSEVILSAVEQKLSGKEQREYKLRSGLAELNNSYDFVILDCPPNIGLLTFNAFLASTEVIIPIDISYFALHGLGKLLETLHIIRKKCDHHLVINALAANYDKRIRLSEEILNIIKKQFHSHFFSSVIHTNVKLKAAVSFGKPITEYNTHCSGYHDYLALSEQVIKGSYLQKQKVDRKICLPQKVDGGVLFSYFSPEALSVCITGDFNEWSSNAEPLFNLSGNGLWQKFIPLPPGQYQYKYVVDGDWHLDPANPKTISGPLGKNSLFKY